VLTDLNGNKITSTTSNGNTIYTDTLGITEFQIFGTVFTGLAFPGNNGNTTGVTCPPRSARNGI
jgi:hypothetical protein